jgi:hypothetical protein
MGVRCKLLGHVHDATEFEERREGRPNGTVLICREYQVCRRCGNREEMYRNEQVLAPGAAETNRSLRETPTDTDPPQRESGTRQAGEQRKREATRERADGTDDTEDAAGTEGDPANAPSDQSGSEDDGRPDTGEGDESEDTAVTSFDRRGESSRDAPANSVTDDAVILPGTTAGTDPSAVDGTRVATDGTGDPPVAPGESGPPPAFDVGDDTGSEISCGSCGREWSRDTTSLREGDICPGCRKAYVEET